MTDKKLKSHRVKIDKIDKEIYALIQKRASHAVAIGKIKSKVSPKESFYKSNYSLENGLEILDYLESIDDNKNSRMVLDTLLKYNPLNIDLKYKSLRYLYLDK